MKTKSRKTVEISEDEAIINAATDRVYRKYGTNLRAFFRDVYEELKRQESSIGQKEIEGLPKKGSVV